MTLLSGCLGAVLVMGAYFGALYQADRRLELCERKRKGFPAAHSILVIGICSFAVMLWLGMRSLTGLPLPMVMLQYVLIWGMSVLAVIDHEKQVIPNHFLLLLLLFWTGIVGLTVLIAVDYGLALFFQSLTGALAGGLIFLLCYLLSGRQLGAGDVKLAFVMGLYLTGQRIIGAVFYGVLLCLFYSVVQLIRKKIGLKDGVPLVPFLYAGVLITLLIMF